MKYGIYAKSSPALWAAVGLSAALGSFAARAISIRRICPAQSLADSLLLTESLPGATILSGQLPEELMTSCAAYLVQVTVAAAAQGLAGSQDDAAGQCRTATHSYTGATSTVLTESRKDDQVLTYAVNIPGVGEVRGTRQVGPLNLGHVPPVRKMMDTMQITLQDNYTVQMETDFQAAENMLLAHCRPSGPVVLRDNHGNAARIFLGTDGHVTGTITRDSHIVGRIEGTAPGQLSLRPSLIPPEKP